ncbi:hypothetical protein HanRHA438_Chr08g0366461 [Helianthus annuus]|nr:hypothetical protein HanRHA438_Chr08g0366461 [Helianthus annuus]
MATWLRWEGLHLQMVPARVRSRGRAPRASNSPAGRRLKVLHSSNLFTNSYQSRNHFMFSNEMLISLISEDTNLYICSQLKR